MRYTKAMPDAQILPTTPDAALALVFSAQRIGLPDLDDRDHGDAFVQNRFTDDPVVLRQGDVLAGWFRRKDQGNLRAVTLDVYRRLFAVAEGWNLARIWNVVPDVNGTVGGVENYHAFNAGRADAFFERFEGEAERRICAACGIGGCNGCLDVSFVAVRGPVTHLENPEQVPAYRYPACYGPKPPNFARATVCDVGGARVGFVSGTAAVKGHASVCGSLEEQCAATVDNLRIMDRQLAQNGLGESFARYINVFIRRHADAPFILDYLARNWTRPCDAVRVHHADICRAELVMEIEFLAIRTDMR